MSGRSYAFGRNSHHPFGSTTPLRRSIAHPGLQEAFGFKAVNGGIKRANRAFALGDRLYFLPNRRAIAILAESRGGTDQKVFKLAQHLLFYIVILIEGKVKMGRKNISSRWFVRRVGKLTDPS
jgi:hypothetical protein